MLWAYDGQLRRYVVQMMRLMSLFPVRDGQGREKKVPVGYGDLTRQVGHIIKENSENKMPSVPRMSVYITGLELDRTRAMDSTHTHSVNVREREFDEESRQYLNKQGKNYTIERLVPTPYTLRCNVDIWTSNTEQKFQLLEQILVWFHPSMEIQTSDNWIDWTSITTVELENIVYSNRSVPTGIDSEIDVATLTFVIPIWISAPAKVKKLGVITNIITNLFAENSDEINSGYTIPEINAYNDSVFSGVKETKHGRQSATQLTDIQTNVNFGDCDVFVDGDTVELIRNQTIESVDWSSIIEGEPGEYIPGLSTIHLHNLDSDIMVAGSFEIDPNNNDQLLVSWDKDTFPSDTVISGPGGDKTTVSYIIDPANFDPTKVKTPGLRLLILGDIGSEQSKNGPKAWKNKDGSDFVAQENDIIEWTGSKWSIVFDASAHDGDVVYTTNLNTITQYKFINQEWLMSVDGLYPVGTWRLQLS